MLFRSQKEGSRAIKKSVALTDENIETVRRLTDYGGVPLQSFNVGNISQKEGSRAIKKSVARSEERRVGKECRSRWSPYH